MSFVYHTKRTSARSCGRTTMLAMHYVQLALDNPGEQILVEDHHPTLIADRYLFDLVCRVLSTLGVHFQYDQTAMSIIVMKPRNPLMGYPEAEDCLNAQREELGEQYRVSRRFKNPII